MNEILSSIEQFEVSDNDFTHESLLHGRLHTHRVMAWVCVLSAKLKMNGQGRLAFFAAKVHDLGRLTDGKEPGHGQRSADLCLGKYRELFEYFGLSGSDYQVVSDAVRWHSRSDEPPDGCNGIEVINLLKDADGLDRVRLGEDEPDIRYFRHSITQQFVPAARQLFEITEEKRNMSLREITKLAFELAQ